MSPRAYRKLKGLTLSQMAEEVGIDNSTLSRIERGRARPGWDVMVRFKEISDGAVMPNDYLQPAANEEAA